MRQVAAASKAYEALAEAYARLDNLPKLEAQINAGAQVWAEVSN
jgi:COP9 signalosome complex subunit 3